jgi:hypothetical protein
MQGPITLFGAPRQWKNFFAPYFKQCFFRGVGVLTPQAESSTTPPSPKTEITNILFYILNFASIINLKRNFSLTFYHNKKQKPPLQIYRPRQLPSLPRPKFAPGVMMNWSDLAQDMMHLQNWGHRNDRATYPPNCGSTQFCQISFTEFESLGCIYPACFPIPTGLVRAWCPKFFTWSRKAERNESTTTVVRGSR